MKVIKPSYEIYLTQPEADAIQKNIEKYGRVCYKSETENTLESAGDFIGKILKRGHESVLEHEKVTVKIICDRGITHELVRHRIASFSQESTRYCNYSKDKFGNELTFILPYFFADDECKMNAWKHVMEVVEQNYLMLVDDLKVSPQEARSVLPNSLKTEIVITMDIREWRHFFKLRCDVAAHPQMREITIPMFRQFKSMMPYLFADMDF